MIADVIRTGWETLGAAVEEPEDGLMKAIKAEADVSGHWAVEELIARRESDRVEFKSSARWHYHKTAIDKVIEDEVVKTVAAFMNSDGGTLLIGVDDDGSVLGLDRDLASVKGKNLDGLDLWLHKKLGDALGKASVGHLVSVDFVEVEEKTIGRVEVSPSPQPIWADTSETKGVMFVRIGASSQRFSAAEAVDYVAQHWGGAGQANAPIPQVADHTEAAAGAPESKPTDTAVSDDVPTGAAATPAEEPDVEESDLEERFHQAMVEVYLNAKSEAGYNATRFIQMVSEHGGLETAKLLLHSADVSDGFTALWEAKRLDLSVEALILDPVWDDLFTWDEHEIARSRLRLYGYEI